MDDFNYKRILAANEVSEYPQMEEEGAAIIKLET